jgi:hypothetical protein
LSLLRASFAGINSRFHLVGISTLLSLLLPMALSTVGQGDEAWAPFVFMGLFVAWGISFAIQGLAYHAATDPPGRQAPSAVRLGLLLFPTLLWLQARLLFVCYLLPFLMALGVRAIQIGAVPDEAWAKQADFWVRVFAQAISLLLTTAATPLAIRLREHGRRGRPIRDSLRFFMVRRREAVLILVLLIPAVIVGAVIEVVRGPSVTDPVPRLPEGFAIFLGSYLELVALFAASRVLALAVLAAPRDADRAGGATDPSEAGPTA